jgi:hypothetical protein
MPETLHGKFVKLEKTEAGDLRIILNNSGRRVFAEIEKIRERLGIDATMRILLDDYFRRNWHEIKPEEIGALTSALIISDEAVRDSDGMLQSVGHVYWNERYQVDDEIEELRTAGAVLFRGAW